MSNLNLGNFPQGELDLKSLIDNLSGEFVAQKTGQSTGTIGYNSQDQIESLGQLFQNDLFTNSGEPILTPPNINLSDGTDNQNNTASSEIIPPDTVKEILDQIATPVQDFASLLGSPQFATNLLNYVAQTTQDTPFPTNISPQSQIYTLVAQKMATAINQNPSLASKLTPIMNQFRFAVLVDTNPGARVIFDIVKQNYINSGATPLAAANLALNETLGDIDQALQDNNVKTPLIGTSPKLPDAVTTVLTQILADTYGPEVAQAFAQGVIQISNIIANGLGWLASLSKIQAPPSTTPPPKTSLISSIVSQSTTQLDQSVGAVVELQYALTQMKADGAAPPEGSLAYLTKIQVLIAELRRILGLIQTEDSKRGTQLTMEQVNLTETKRQATIKQLKDQLDQIRAAEAAARSASAMGILSIILPIVMALITVILIIVSVIAIILTAGAATPVAAELDATAITLDVSADTALTTSMVTAEIVADASIDAGMAAGEAIGEAAAEAVVEATTTGILDSITTILTSQMTWIITLVSSVISLAMEAAQEIIDHTVGMQKLMSLVQDLFMTVIGDIFAGMGIPLPSWLQTTIEVLFWVAVILIIAAPLVVMAIRGNVGPIMEVITPIVAMVTITAVTSIITSSSLMQNIVGNIVQAAGGSEEDAMWATMAVTFVLVITVSMFGMMSAAPGAMGTAVGTVSQKVKQLIQQLQEGIMKAVQKLVQAAAKEIKDLIQSMATGAKKILSELKGLDQFMNMIDKHINEIKNLPKALMQDLKPELKMDKIFDKIIDLLQKAQAMTQAGGDLAQSINSLLQALNDFRQADMLKDIGQYEAYIVLLQSFIKLLDEAVKKLTSDDTDYMQMAKQLAKTFQTMLSGQSAALNQLYSS